MNASEFIRENPDFKAKELVEKGKAKGLKFSTQLVYQVRMQDKRKKNGTKKRRPGRPKKSRKNGHRAARKSIPVSLSAIVEQFKKDLEACYQQQVVDMLSESLGLPS